jgi:hypothetical protein
MQLNKLIETNRINSAQIYMRRVELESQKNMILNQISQVESEMLRLDGEMRLLDLLKSEELESNKEKPNGE